MEITDANVYLLKEESIPASSEWHWREGLPEPHVYKPRDRVFLQIATDEGIDGYASVPHAEYTANLARKYFKDILIGVDPLNKELLFHKMWELDRVERVARQCFGLIDMALWDITSKKAQLPLYQLLGGYREKVLAYASTATYDTLEDFLDVADQCIERGYKGIKLHAWGDARRDAELCQKLRAHVGEEIYLMYDGSAGFDFYDALYVGKALEEADYYWYEEPMIEYNIYAYRKLADALRVPLLDAEVSPGSFFNTSDFIHFGHADLVRISVGLKYGITGSIKIAHLAESFNLRAEVHGGGPLNMQIICAIKNTSFYESFIWDNPINDAPEVDPDGYVHVDKEPGIYREVDIEKIKKRAYESFSVLDH